MPTNTTKTVPFRRQSQKKNKNVGSKNKDMSAADREVTPPDARDRRNIIGRPRSRPDSAKATPPHSSRLLENRDFWEALSDHEFFGPSVTHVYFYEDVNEDSVATLRTEILEAARGTQEEFLSSSTRGAKNDIRLSPKPIVVHVHSLGGKMWAGNWLLSLFNQVHVPICTLVDSESASAATFLTVSSPYRVATPFSKSLLHDYSAVLMGKREELLSTQDVLERQIGRIKQMYLSRTKFTREELTELLRHDKWLDADFCEEKGLYDRVLRPDVSDVVRRAMGKLDKSRGGPGINSSPFFKTNWNVIYSTCTSMLPMELDSVISAQENSKPVVYTAPGDIHCDDPSVSFACIPRLQSFMVPVFGVVDNDLTWNEMLPIQYCHRRFMYDNAHVISDLAYVYAQGRLEDVIHNVNLDRSTIIKVLTDRGKPTKEFLADIFERSRYISAEECLRMGLVDEIIDTGTVLKKGYV